MAAILVLFPWHWIVLLFSTFVGDVESEGNLELGGIVRFFGAENVERLGYGFITPYTMIVVSARIAPSGKLLTGKVVAGLSVLLLIVTHLTWSPDYFRYSEGIEKLYPIVLAALNISAIYIALRSNQKSLSV